ncbi:MAG: zinc-dependent metalloprotease [Chthonomonas sp.]|nr:zinc-dependent metalloprotease [Chthonomonas sp.]
MLIALAASPSLIQEGPGPRGGRGQQPTAPASAEAKAPDNDAFATAIKDFEAKKGALDTYLKGEQLYFAIPKDKFGRDFLWYIELKATPNGGYSGSSVGEGVVRFEKRGDKVLLRQIFYNVQSSDPGNTKTAVEQSNVMPIIQAFDPRATSSDGTVLVDVSRLFRSGLPEFPMAGSIGGAAFDSSRTFIDRVVAFPDNVNVEVTATASGGGGAARNPFGGGGVGGRPSNTGVLHHSMVLLPEKPMQGRIKDSRVGYFSNGYVDFGAEQNRAKEFEFITRYRLEKKNPREALSEPVKPIIYYIAKEVPAKWHPYVKAGVEEWNVAFEAAGFKNAIRCEPAPNDPNWSAEDVRYSTIRWAPLQIANAMGPHVNDPRSGEILSAHVIMWHDVLQLAEEWYFAQASPNDPRAQKIPLPLDVIGPCLQFVVAHEVGHTLGLPHNGKSSAMVPTELLRNKEWTNTNGTAGSIMDYARFNYVAQPGDGANLIPIVGPYDKFSIKWGYMPIDGVSNSSDERPVLDALASQMVTNPLLRFYDNFNGSDPTAQSEALGDDAVIASTYGMMNLERIMGFLMPATVKLGEEYEDLNRMYGAVWDQYNLYIGHVLTMVGGVVQTNYLGGRGGNVYAPVPAGRQRAATQWLIDHVLASPDYLTPTNVLAKIGPASGASRVSAAQRRAINGLLQDGRVGRMMDNQLMYRTGPVYTVQEMFTDLREGIWTELDANRFSVGAQRRNMQRFWVNTLIAKLGTATGSELRAYVLAELRTTQKVLDAKSPNAMDTVTRQHMEDLSQMIDLALKFPAPAAAPAPQQTLAQLLGLPITESENRDCGFWTRHEHASN